MMEINKCYAKVCPRCFSCGTHKWHREISFRSSSVYWKRNNNKNRIKEMSINLLQTVTNVSFFHENIFSSTSSQQRHARSFEKTRKFSFKFYSISFCLKKNHFYGVEIKKILVGRVKIFGHFSLPSTHVFKVVKHNLA